MPIAQPMMKMIHGAFVLHNSLKNNNPETMLQYRPIAIISVLAKLYNNVLDFLAHPFFTPLQGPQFAFMAIPSAA